MLTGFYAEEQKDGMVVFKKPTYTPGAGAVVSLGLRRKKKDVNGEEKKEVVTNGNGKRPSVDESNGVNGAAGKPVVAASPAAAAASSKPNGVGFIDFSDDFGGDDDDLIDEDDLLTGDDLAIPIQQRMFLSSPIQP